MTGESEARVIALGGNPNVGKSTVFNALTGLRQHTGNWPGKTVSGARGVYWHRRQRYTLVDLPGTYSLAAHSPEEAVARDFLLFGQTDAVVIVCDATCLERSLRLVYQAMEITPQIVVCVNLLDEAQKKGVRLDLSALERVLGLPVVGVSARSGEGLETLMDTVGKLCAGEIAPAPVYAAYPREIEDALAALTPQSGMEAQSPDRRCQAVRLLGERGAEDLRDSIAQTLVAAAETAACAALITGPCRTACERQQRADTLLTGRFTGVPLMLLMLCAVFWLTLTGANVPSRMLSDALFRGQDALYGLMERLSAAAWFRDALVLGVYRTLAWVVSVMLPPMAIFFPLFTLLEDLGYLPRVAFTLDRCFCRAKACGKQALTMCMGLGCNAVGVTGCRIIDSPRERLIAILTNSFMPCNGRFPTLIALITLFFLGRTAGGAASTALMALMLTVLILLGALTTFVTSRVLSGTVLKGQASSFALELPPFRMPQVGKVLVRSLLDRTLFVLGRAVAVAAPAGLVIWVLANVQTGGMSLLAHCAGFLNPLGRFFGMDGVILLAFILGFPANEIVMPIMLMAYMSGGILPEATHPAALWTLLTEHGWTWVTAVCVMIFCLMHWPCSTTCWTIRKETGSWRLTLLAMLLPTAVGLLLCAVVANAARLLG